MNILEGHEFTSDEKRLLKMLPTDHVQSGLIEIKRSTYIDFGKVRQFSLSSRKVFYRVLIQCILWLLQKTTPKKIYMKTK